MNPESSTSLRNPPDKTVKSRLFWTGLSLSISALFLVPLVPGLGLILFMAGGFSVYLSVPMPSFGLLSTKSPALESWESWFLGLLILSAALVRLLFLNDFPSGAHGHEGEMAVRTMILEKEAFLIHIPDGNINWPSLIFYQGLAAAKIFNWAPWSLRLPGALWGLLSIPLFYFLARRLTSPFAAALASVLLCGSQMHMVISRNFFPGSLLFVAVEATFLALLIGIEKKKWFWFSIAGFFAGLGLWGYIPGRILPFLFTGWILLIFFLKSGSVRKKDIFAFLLPLLLLSLPFIIFQFKNPAQYWEYLKHQNPSQNKGLAAYFKTFFENFPHYLKMFHIKGDFDPGTQIPLLPVIDRWVGLLFPLGFFICLAAFKRPAALLILSWISLAILPAVMGGGFAHPTTRRTMLAIPAFYLLAAVSIKYIFEGLRSFERPRLHKLAGLLLILTTLGTCVWTLNGYFRRFYTNSKVLPHIDHLSWQMHKDSSAYPDAQLHFSRILRASRYWKSQSFFFLKRRVEMLEEFEDIFRLDQNRDQLVFLEPLYEPMIPVLKHLYPGIEISRRMDPTCPEAMCGKDYYNKKLLYVLIHLTAETAAKAQGLTLEIDNVSSRIPDLKNLRFGKDQSGKKIKISGSWAAPRYGCDSMIRSGLKNPRILFNGKKVISGKNHFSGSLINIEISGTIPAGGTRQSVLHNSCSRQPPRFLHRPISLGFKVRYYKALSESGIPTPKFSRRYLAPLLRLYRHSGIHLPYYMVWETDLRIPVSGIYRFKTELWCKTLISLNGEKVFDNTLKKGFPQPVALEKNQKIRLRIDLPGSDKPDQERVLQLLWQTPAGPDFQALNPSYCTYPDLSF